MIVLTSFMLWYSGFLPYHKELVEESEKCNKMDVSCLSMIFYFDYSIEFVSYRIFKNDQVIFLNVIHVVYQIRHLQD